MRVQMGPGGFGRAVDLVAETRDASLGALVDEALQGCADAAQWHVRLQLALGQRDEAANLALAIAQEEQLAGNYKVPFTPSLSVQGCMSGVATSTSKMALPAGGAREPGGGLARSGGRCRWAAGRAAA